MITRIGVISEDTRSYGFLLGLRDRLECEAELIPPPAPIGVTTHLTKKTARQAWKFFQKRGAGLVVRFVDADGKRWQDIVRREQDVWPDEGHSIYLCGVAVDNVEDWLGLDRGYVASKLEIGHRELEDDGSRSERIKRAIDARGSSKSETVADVVRDCPQDVFRRWLDDPALGTFYDDCRRAAQAANCDTPNERDPNS